MRQPSLFDEPPSPTSFPSQSSVTPAEWVPLSNLAPAAEGPRLSGIARLAAEAEEIDVRNQVEYRELPCRTLLSRCQSSRVPLDYNLNPYRGCEFACTYCLAPETPILYADMTWRPIGEVKVGDVLAGFDENPTEEGNRRFRPSVVEAVWWSRKPTLRLVTEHTEVITTAEHRWLQARNFRWSRTEQLTPGRHLRYMPVEKFEPPDDDYRIGYLIGVTWGDGTFRYQPGQRSDKLGFPQAYWRVAMVDREPLERLVEYLAVLGIEAQIRPFQAETATCKALQKIDIRSLGKLERLHQLLQTPLQSRNHLRGFLAGFFDAEGSSSESLRISQVDLEVLRQVQEYGERLGFTFQLEPREGKASTLRLVGDLANRVRFFAVCQPAIVRKRDAVFGCQMELQPERVVAVEPGEVRDVVDIQTSTRTFYAAGLATHNCYARYTHEFMEFEDWLDFERKIFVKQGAREALVRDLRRLDLRGKLIAIGTATDPYQPAERRYGLTRSLLEVFAGRRGLDLSITTKSDLVVRDLDLLQQIAAHNDLQVNVTITTPHHELSRRTEPRAPRPDKRLAAVRALREGGIRAGVFLMPILPRITDSLEDLELLVRLAKEADAQFLSSQVLFLRSCSRKRFFPFIEERFPELLPYYRRMYGGREGEALAAYTRQKLEEIQQLKRRYGLGGYRRLNEHSGPEGEQLGLSI